MTITLPQQKIIVPCCQTIEFVLASDILYMEGLQNYARVHIADGSQLVSTKNLGYYRDRLSDNNFFSCHKSYLINVDKIVRYHKHGVVEMIDSTQIPISRRRKDAFLKIMLDNCD